jgi:branched-subunit amino acid aminotransferase/4-amino-4-deoxychorismate lyase
MQNIAPFVWKDGKMIEWDQAQDNNFTHTMHYGS